jgi:hypothetical protein
MKGKLKGQIVFEFVIASLILFSVIVYTISFIASDFNTRHGRFLSDRLESNSIRVSNLLLSDHKDIGIVGVWPETDQNMIDDLMVECGDYPSLQESLGLREESPYVTYMHFNITVADESTMYVNCGRELPEGTGKAVVTRYALSPSKSVARIEVTVW